MGVFYFERINWLKQMFNSEQKKKNREFFQQHSPGSFSMEKQFAIFDWALCFLLCLFMIRLDGENIKSGYNHC